MHNAHSFVCGLLKKNGLYPCEDVEKFKASENFPNAL